MPARMTGSQLTKIITHDAPGEFRAAALDPSNRPWRLFQQRWDGAFAGLQAGDVVAARLRSRGSKHDGSFGEADSGEAVLVTGDLPEGISEGAAFRIEIRAEARRDKLARGVATTAPVRQVHAFERWKDSFPGGRSLLEHEDTSGVDSAFDSALMQTTTLPGGGQIHIEATRALTAIDVDTSGRSGRGSAGARALSINREAAEEAARQCALRDQGGAIVIDCINPLNQSARQAVANAFQETFQSVSKRSVDVVTPSKFGLMQVALAWEHAPLSHRLFLPDGTPTPETRLLGLFRDLEREAAANGAALFRVDLSQSVFELYLMRRDRCDAILKQRFGGRVEVRRSEDDRDEIRTR
ncbi:MAG: ribonuclease E/G [Pseudomonadota bacterium]